MRSLPRTVSVSDWPPLPPGGVFPEVLTTIEVAQLLRYDADGMILERAKRNVQWLVRNRGLPVLAKVGQRYLYRKVDILAWLAHRNADGNGLPSSPADDVRQASDNQAS